MRFRRRLRRPCGSSPLTRGKPSSPRHWHRRTRLIPAHAGKTCRSGSGWQRARAHPRSRGENRGVYRYSEDPEGSSPLTRGKQPPEQLSGAAWRLIPAHAGKTIDVWRGSEQIRAHPRSRGENHAVVLGSGHSGGSSPLTRGKRVIVVGLDVGFGLIPAHAGKTSLTWFDSSRYSAHPRSRGENLAFVVPMVFVGGSSPLTRGKRRRIRR